MVESVNKLVKYRYLFPKNLPDGEALTKAFAESVIDYNDIRPHGSLGGLTPSETYRGVARDSLHAHGMLKAAQKLRIERNRQGRCISCRA